MVLVLYTVFMSACFKRFLIFLEKCKEVRAKEDFCSVGVLFFLSQGYKMFLISVPCWRHWTDEHLSLTLYDNNILFVKSAYLQWCSLGSKDKGQHDCRHVFTCGWVHPAGMNPAYI